VDERNLSGQRDDSHVPVTRIVNFRCGGVVPCVAPQYIVPFRPTQRLKHPVNSVLAGVTAGLAGMGQ